MAWRMPAAIVHGRLSQVVLIFATTVANMVATNSDPALSSAPHRNGMIGQQLNVPCVQREEEGARAVNQTSHQIILDIKANGLLIPISTTTFITSAVVPLRVSPPYWFRTTFLSAEPVRMRCCVGRRN